MSELVQVEVSLMGRTFTIATPSEERDTLLEAVRLLGEKVEAIQGQGRIVDADKIAIMAALNIAHDLLKTKVGDGLEMAAFQRKIRSMGEAADEALRSSKQALF
ncbi:cell division protein ZapA [Crenobacter sp. SG2303]|uniref:Cell division protein ZapA n=1 Tax=Crenobacter oryzisoli TaxID=3056844 RepID=A0ABT7XUU8_9NEIS|nr:MULTISPECIES: cell division protein ZapA [unclassified Crenobacter]MDN0077513.1 cell division protein ZapA [Crenobacter sp. SG2303]MDN0083827.1 cell division protein ZapA [Crenobacter sp. SG2305]